MKETIFSGELRSGQGKGVYFTQLDWARRQFQEKLGIEPHPGTFNLILRHAEELARWQSLREEAGIVIEPPDPQNCAARSYPVRINAFLPGAVIHPNLPDYPNDQLEIISALNLRQALDLKDGDLVQIEVNRPLEVRAVVFDVDGTLIDTLEAYRVCTEKAFAPLGIPVTIDMIRHYFATHQPFWESLLPADQADRTAVLSNLEAEALRHFPEALRSHGKVFPNLARTMNRLQCKSLKLGIFTGSTRQVLEPLREQDLLSCFDAVTTGEDVERHKPHPEGLHHCLRQLGVEPEQAAYVGDTTMDIQACRAAGTKSIAVLTGAGDCSALAAEGPDWTIHSHQHLPAIVTNENR